MEAMQRAAARPCLSGPRAVTLGRPEGGTQVPRPAPRASRGTVAFARTPAPVPAAAESSPA
jgi:hypothetical protein